MLRAPLRSLNDAEIFTPLVARLDRIVAQARAAGEPLALLLVHCAGVERTDSAQGFHAGGIISNAIENLLRRQALRSEDSVEALSREEFVCIVRRSSSPSVALLAAHRIQAVLAPPLGLGNGTVPAEASIGIALYPEHAGEADALLQRAKAAQRSALGERDRIAIYSDQAVSKAADEAVYEKRLRRALHENALSLAFQPQLDLRTGRVIGAEALLRWTDEELGTVPPNRTVAVAESAGLMDQLTFWVITSAIQWCSKAVKLDPAFTVSVNISPSNLREPDLPAFIDRALRTWDVPARNLVVEITETAMLVDQASANDALNELKSYGVRLSVDDFGTGYSSMYYLAQLPLEELKIDLMFVRDMLSVPVHAKIVRSLVELAHNLELTVVAEGVENAEIQSALAHLGCDRVQGYHIGKPIPGAEFIGRFFAR
ncbi:MAG TPA: GGDEF domain-containing phosphodiesterase [Burkholderiales bacterium]|nr:GGDEF domain-containing phosphodiesterase [Burkholderiales bacterium]